MPSPTPVDPPARAKLLAEILLPGTDLASDDALRSAKKAASAATADNRVIALALALPQAAATRAKLHQLFLWQRRLILLAVVIVLLLGFGAGWAITRSDGGPLNIFLTLLVLLGPHGLSFVLWLAMLALTRPGAVSDGSLTRLTAWAAKKLAPPPIIAAVFARHWTRWHLAAVSHGLWFCLLAAAGGGLWLLFSVKGFVFVWDSTILSQSSYAWLTRTLGFLPSQLGFALPDTDQIARAGLGGSPGDRVLWAEFLFGCLLLYGLLPRLVAFLVCWALGAWHSRRAPLMLPPVVRSRVQALITGVEIRARVTDPDTGATPKPSPRPIGKAKRSTPGSIGPVGVLGWELVDWPPDLPVGVSNLGNVEGVKGPKPNPAIGRHLIIADLSQTPDRGVASGLTRLTEGLADPVILLTGSRRAESRLGIAQLEDRLADWLTLLHDAGLGDDRVHLADLSTSEGQAVLQDLAQ